tara:strand:+ start:1020 stop:2252 length:1233 start_codon:yes stop_codon:yes gene_type:complete
MKKVNRIGLLINWAREIDMYSSLISVIPKNKLQIITNDLSNTAIIRQNNLKNIEKGLKKKKLKFKKLSQIKNKFNYKVLISTGETGAKTYNVISIIKFLYFHTIGKIIKFIKLDNIFIFFFNRPFTCSGSQNIYIQSFIEKSISQISIKFPWTMDLNYKSYPDNRWEKNYDIFFTHGKLDSKLIKKKFFKSEVFRIGYPRYDNLKISSRTAKKKIKKLFGIKNKKKIIFWIPTHIDTKNEVGTNIIFWMEIIKKLQNNYNIIIRPHTKTLNYNKKLFHLLQKNGFLVDNESDRKIGELFKGSDLVIADYGGSIFSSIYMLKPTLLLNLPKNTEYVINKIFNKTFDIQLRNKIISLNLHDKKKDFIFTIEKLLTKNEANKIKKVKNYFFGKKNNKNQILKTRKYLLDLLKK